MTERVVDGLEIIEIDDEQRPRSRLVAGHAGKGHVEGGAVWQSRECVDARAPFPVGDTLVTTKRSEEHTSELQSLMRISYAVFCLKKTNQKPKITYRVYIDKK